MCTLPSTLAVFASAALLAVPAGAAAAATSTAGHRTPGASIASAMKLHVFKEPTQAYTEAACSTGLSTVPDHTPVELLVNDCGFQISLSSTTIKRSVHATWQPWAVPPFVESARPGVLYTHGATSLTLTWGSQNTIGGVEVQSRHDGRDSFHATFYSGPDGTGTVVGTVVRRDVVAPGGARLLAAKTSSSWQSLEITDLSGHDFAIAQVRGA